MYPVDDRTPSIKNLVFSNIDCHNSHVAAAYFHGLPEQPIEMIIMENINVTYAKNPKMDVPAMMEDISLVQKLEFLQQILLPYIKECFYTGAGRGTL